MKFLIGKNRVFCSRIALSRWLSRSASLAFSLHSQRLETLRTPRGHGHDPRVPPRIDSVLVDEDTVASREVMTCVTLPLVHEDGILLVFGPADGDGKPPILANVVQRGTRLCTVVTLQVQLVDGSWLKLRKFSYLREFGEFHAPNPVAKRRFEQAKACCRFDLISLDGSLALELELPAGAGSADTDYFVVRKATLCLHKLELLQRFRPQLMASWTLFPLAVSSETGDSSSSRHENAMIRLCFHKLNGDLVSQWVHRGLVQVDDQSVHHTSRNPTNGFAGHARESFCVFSFETTQQVRCAFPTDPGYLWLRIMSASTAKTLVHAVMLHDKPEETSGGKLLVTKATWLPGMLEMYPGPQQIQRRCLKGTIQLVFDRDRNIATQTNVVAQFLPPEVLARYAVSIQSYTGLPTNTS